MKRGRAARGTGFAAWLLVGALATGCATSTPPPVSVPAARPAAPPARTGAPGAPDRAPGPVASARADSLPTPDAERVLAGIPEPLAPSERVPPPERDSTVRRSVPAPETAHDTLRVGGAGGEDVPVPAPTAPLTPRATVTFAAPESLAARPAAPAPFAAPPPATSSATPATGESASPPPAGSAPAAPGGPCWRVQVAAPAERAEAESRLEAARSLLMIEMAIVPEKGLFKVRTRDCLGREAAEALRRRAVDSGFEGSFLVDTTAPARPAPAKRPRSRPSRRGVR